MITILYGLDLFWTLAVASVFFSVTLLLFYVVYSFCLL